MEDDSLSLSFCEETVGDLVAANLTHQICIACQALRERERDKDREREREREKEGEVKEKERERGGGAEVNE